MTKERMIELLENQILYRDDLVQRKLTINDEVTMIMSRADIQGIRYDGDKIIGCPQSQVAKWTIVVDQVDRYNKEIETIDEEIRELDLVKNTIYKVKDLDAKRILIKVYLDGETISSIANTDGRDWKTVKAKKTKGIDEMFKILETNGDDSCF